MFISSSNFHIASVSTKPMFLDNGYQVCETAHCRPMNPMGPQDLLWVLTNELSSLRREAIYVRNRMTCMWTSKEAISVSGGEVNSAIIFQV